MKALFGSLSVLPGEIFLFLFLVFLFFFVLSALIQTHLLDMHELTCLFVWLTAKHGVEQNMDPVEEHVKKTIVTAARETWEIYFSRLFPASVRERNNYWVCFFVLLFFFFIKLLYVYVCVCVCVQGSVGTGVQVLSVSHSGIKLLKTVKSSAAAPDYFRVLRPYTYVLLSHVSLCLNVSINNWFLLLPSPHGCVLLVWNKSASGQLRFQPQLNLTFSCSSFYVYHLDWSVFSRPLSQRVCHLVR